MPSHTEVVTPDQIADAIDHCVVCDGLMADSGGAPMMMMKRVREYPTGNEKVVVLPVCGLCYPVVEDLHTGQARG